MKKGRRQKPAPPRRRPSVLVVLVALAAAALVAGAVVAVLRAVPNAPVDPIAHLSSPIEDGTYDVLYWSVEQKQNSDRWSTAVATCKRLGEVPNCRPVLQLQFVQDLIALRDQVREDALHPERIRERMRAIAEQHNRPPGNAP